MEIWAWTGPVRDRIEEGEFVHVLHQQGVNGQV